MSRADAWMPLYIGDYLSDTMHLGTVQHGAYLLLLMHYWRNGPLPNDPEHLRALVRCERKPWDRDVWPVLARFFTLADDNLLHQGRMDREISRRADVSGKRRDAANTRHAKPDGEPGSNAPAGANAMHNACKPDANASPMQTHAGARQSQSQRTEEGGESVPVAARARAEPDFRQRSAAPRPSTVNERLHAMAPLLARRTTDEEPWGAVIQ